MYKELKETEVKTADKIINQYKGLAYLITEPENIIIKGIAQPHQGKLYAISDRADLDKLYETARQLRDNGIEILINTCPLDADKLFLAW